MAAHVMTHAVAQATIAIAAGVESIRYAGSAPFELRRRNARRAVVGVCTAGGMATAALLERP